MNPRDVFSIVTVIIFTSLKKRGSYFVGISNDRNQHWTTANPAISPGLCSMTCFWR